MIYHAYSAYNPLDTETKRRVVFARSTWACQPWIECPLPDSLSRKCDDCLSGVPFIKDIVDNADRAKNDEDIIVLTNSDISCSVECCYKIVASLMFSDAVAAKRRDFPKLDVALTQSEIRRGDVYKGLDLFAFRSGWWRKHRQELPDVVIGREKWDYVFFVLIEITNPGNGLVLDDVIYHESHQSPWSNPSLYNKLDSQLNNRNVCDPWLRSKNVDLSRFCQDGWT